MLTYYRSSNTPKEECFGWEKEIEMYNIEQVSCNDTPTSWYVDVQ